VISDRLEHGDRLAAQHRLVDRALTGEYLTVHRDALAGPDDDRVPSRHLLDGHVDL
jgi:hypothetical protein